MNGQTLQKAFVPLPGNGTAAYNSSGLSYYRHPDWLGSSRLASTPSRTVYSTTAYAPFGETYSQSGSSDPSFTGMNQDTVGGSYDFLFREYSTQGRWPSPDPAGLAAVDSSNPQSWNRYAYLLNSPLNLIDPTGLCGEPDTFTTDPNTGVYTLTSYPPCPPPPPPPPSGPSSLALLSLATCPFLATGAFGPPRCTMHPTGDLALVAAWRKQQRLEQNGVEKVVNVIRRLLPAAGSAIIAPFAVSVAVIPRTLQVCVGGGVGASFPPVKVFSGGPLVNGDLSNAPAILSGASWSFNGQLHPARGYQTIQNSRGIVGGPTAANSPGISFSYTYSACTAAR